MTVHHQHQPGHAHPPVTVSPSILRMSVWQRLAVGVVASLALWGVVFWAMGSPA